MRAVSLPTRTISRTSALSLVLVAGLALTGCTSESSPSGDENTDGADISAIEKDDSVAAALPDSIKDKGELVVGSDGSYAPAEFLGEDGRTLKGYEIDITDAMGKLMGVEIKHVNSAFDQILPSVGSRYDVGASSFTITPERLEQVGMVSMFKAGTSYAVAKGNPQNISQDDLCGKKVAVQTGTTQLDMLNDMKGSCSDPMEILPYPKQTDVATAVVGGKAEVMLADSPVVAYAVKQSNGKIELLGDAVDVATQGFVVGKDDDKLAEAVQMSLQKLIDSGEMKKILTKWGVEDGMIETSEVNPTN